MKMTSGRRLEERRKRALERLQAYVFADSRRYREIELSPERMLVDRVAAAQSWETRRQNEIGVLRKKLYLLPSSPDAPRASE